MRLTPDHWYPVLLSRELRRRPVGVERLGRRLVFWRSADGTAHALPDRCPHLGAALSGGAVRGDRLVCPFHGFEFDTAGACRHIPAIGRAGRIPVAMALDALILREAHGFLWLWWGTPRAQYPDLPYFTELESGWRHATITVDWPVHYSRAIENQLDVAHLPFIHRSTIGAGGETLVEGPHVEADEAGIRIWITNVKDTGQRPREPAELAAAAAGTEPTVSFRFPGTWLLNIAPRFKNVIAFVPVNERHTRYYLRAYHRREPAIVASLFAAATCLSNRMILSQDRRVVVTQTPPDSADARADRPLTSDRAIIEYRRLQARLLARTDSATPVAD